MEKRCHRGAISLALILWKALEADLLCAPREKVDTAEEFQFKCRIFSGYK